MAGARMCPGRSRCLMILVKERDREGGYAWRKLAAGAVRCHAIGLFFKMTSMADTMTQARAERKITGRTVLFWMIGFFTVIFIANAIFIHLALSSFPGVVTETAYEEGLAYNDAIAASREQAARDWSVTGAIERAGTDAARVEVLARDASGAPLSGLSVTATLQRPASPEAPLVVVLQEGETGRYQAMVNDLAAGNWNLDLEALGGQDGEAFKSRNRVFLAQ
jgi:nitrogen fixation protein FixH